MAAVLLVWGLEIAVVHGLPENLEPPKRRHKFHNFQLLIHRIAPLRVALTITQRGAHPTP
jgi:hypothetical protein